MPIYRAYNPTIGDHLQGNTQGEGAASGWNNEGISFSTFVTTQGGDLPLYRCRVTNTAFHFLSTSASCEGQTSEPSLGYLSSTPRSGLVQVVRCRSPAGADHLSTTSPTECANAGYVNEGSQGYAVP
jgi:hypothetical protein